ncbi:MAG: right-handed parallel beta-helix repeat-containing protein, partial [Lysobacter sp.]
LALTGLLSCCSAFACDAILPSQQISIVAPGKYCLSANRTLPVEIDSADVELDCRGHSIVATAPAGASIGVYARSADKVTVRNCRVENFDRGIRLSVKTSGQVLNNTLVHITQDSVRIENSPYGDPTQQTEPTRVVGNRVIGYFSGGMLDYRVAISVAELPDMLVSNNVVVGYAGFAGLRVYEAPDVQVIGNQFLDFTRSAELIGIYNSPRARIIHNTIMSAPGTVGTGLFFNRIDTGATCVENVFINVQTTGFDKCAVTRYNVAPPL